MISETEREWSRQNLALQRQWREEEVSKYREWRARTEKNLRAKFAAQQAAKAQKTPPPPATRGTGWRVLEAPRVPHAALEKFARGVFDFVWHSIDWPQGWRVRWGTLDDTLLSLAGAAEACAARQLGTVLGLCVMTPKIILLDEDAQRTRTSRQFATTIIHELVHAQQRGVAHGPKFEAALRAATDYYFGAADAPAPAPFMTSASAPSPWAGMRFRPGGLYDPQLEYRG